MSIHPPRMSLIIPNISRGLWLPAPAPIIENEVEVNATKPLKLSDNKWQLRLTLNGSYLYALQIRLRPNVELIKWSLLDIIPEPNEWNGKTGYFVMVNHGLEAPPLQLHMEFNVMVPFISISFKSLFQSFNLFGFDRRKPATADHSLT